MPVGAPGTNYYFGGVTVENLRQLLQDKLDWVIETRGATRVSVMLTGEQLDAILSRLEQPATDLPKIEPRLLHPQEPRGTRRSPEEVAKRLAEMYGQSEELRGKFLRTCA